MKIKLSLVLLLVLILTCCDNKYDELNLNVYEYRDTKTLVTFVYDCAEMLREGGSDKLQTFIQNREDYRFDGYYLYIYTMDGINVFHSGMPELENTNLMEITDINGKKVLKLILKALDDTHNPHSWVHFTWCQPGTFFPVPKSSCHFHVTTDDGKEYFVGGGLDYPQEEKEFIRITVDSAAELLKDSGLSALDSISDYTSQFNFRDVRTFVIAENGEILISPFAGNTIFDFDLLDTKDEVGHKPFAKAMKNLEENDSVWQIFMAKNRYKRIPTKKCIYLKKVMLAEKTVIVGAITDLPLPPWSS